MNVNDLFRGDVLALEPAALQRIQARIGADFNVNVPIAAEPRAKARTEATAIAVIPLYDFLAQRRDWLMSFIGGTALTEFDAVFAAAVDSPAIGAIVIDVDSPGGAVGGVPETAARVYAARAKKPVIAVANSMAASAAYWIAAAADELVVTPGDTKSSSIRTCRWPTTRGHSHRSALMNTTACSSRRLRDSAARLLRG